MSLTAAGRRALNATMPQAIRAEKMVMDALTPKQRDALFEVLGVMSNLSNDAIDAVTSAHGADLRG